MENTLQLIKNAQDGDLQAKDRLVQDNLGLVWSIVKRFNGRGYDTEDLFQIGSIGLIKAIEKFDFTYNVRFSTYAVPMIIGEIKRFMRDDGMIKVSRSLKTMANNVKATRQQLVNKLGREPTLQEIAWQTGFDKEDIIMALEADADVESLYTTVHQGEGNPVYLIDKVKQKDNVEEKMIDSLAIKEFIEQLEPKERKIIEMRYFMDKTQTEIASVIGISQVQVSRLEKKILTKMREMLK